MPSASISCVICVYNEADRIESILAAVLGHDRVAEIIVVNDGSTDGTKERLAKYEDRIQLISYDKNRGKTYALGQGIGRAKGELLLLLDADLVGLTARHITELLTPVTSGTADVSMSLLQNSLGIHRFIGLDFVRGERVLPRTLLADAEQVFPTLPRWGAEVFTNDRIIRAKLRLAVVDWPDVCHTRKYEKLGFWKGLKAEVGMVRDALSVTPIPEVIRQNYRMLRLKRGFLRADAPVGVVSSSAAQGSV